MQLRTWHIELLVVGSVLLLTTKVSSGPYLRWVCGLAVVFTFMHLQIAMRHAEAASANIPHLVIHCHRWSIRYHIVKEALWAFYFVKSNQWSALVGVAAMTLYPVWRAYWRRRHPLTTEST